MQNEKMQEAYGEIKSILKARTINDDDLQGLKEKYGEENLKGALIECLPEDIGLKLFMEKTILDDMYEGGATRVAYETLKRNQSDPANLGSVYEDVLNDLDEENKRRYAESEPIILTGGVISGCEQDSKERKPSFKKLVVAGAVLTLTAICSIALVACNNKEKDQGGINTDPPIVSAQTTAGEIFDNVVDKNALMNFASDCATDKVKEAFAGAESVDFVSSTQDGKSFALVTKGGETILYAIVSDLTEVDRAILNENAESQVWEISEMNRDTAVKESEEEAVTQKITDAVAQYKTIVSEIIENATLTKTEYTQIDDSLVANDQVAKALGNFEAVFFGPMTESMKYTGDEQLSTENCTMSYAFGLNKDGTLTTFVVTYPDNGETSQEKLDAIASGSALISNAGTIIPGKTFEFPPLEQKEQIVSFEELYNQVFGDYEYLSTEQQLYNLAKQINNKNELLFADFNDDGLVLYADLNSGSKSSLLKMTYVGANFEKVKESLTLLQNVDAYGLTNYLQSIYENNFNQGSEILTAEFENFKNDLSQAKSFLEAIPSNNFTRLGMITNTTTSIDFSKFTEEFMPDGVEPIVPCYVADLSGRLIDTKYFENYSYYSSLKIGLVYKSVSGEIIIDEQSMFVGALNNQESSKSLYDRLLMGEADKDFVYSMNERTIVENPILIGNTSGITAQEEEAELSK